jgi:hypothetical protein
MTTFKELLDNYTIDKMKKRYLFLFFIAVMAIGATSCRATRIHVNGNGAVPPGQMKKITGAKSAKQYAPGQNKVKKSKSSKKSNNDSQTYKY